MARKIALRVGMFVLSLLVASVVIFLVVQFLPGDVAPGDLLAVPASGAYSRSMASNYNYTPRPAVVSVRDGKVSTLIRRETLDDLLALDGGLSGE